MFSSPKPTWFTTQLTILKDQDNGELIDDLILIEEAFNAKKMSLIEELKEYQDTIRQKSKEIETLSPKSPTKNNKKQKTNQDLGVIKQIEGDIKKLQEEIEVAQKNIDSVNETLAGHIDLLKTKLKRELDAFEKQQQITISTVKIRELVEANQLLPITFNLLDNENFDVLTHHIASNKPDTEGTYARSQNKSIWWKYHHLQDLENRFKELVKGITVEGKSPNIGANTTRLNSLYMFQSSSELTLSSPKSSNKAARKIKDDILNHKNDVVKKLVNGMQNRTLETLSVNPNQLEANYPCLMIQFKNPPYNINNEILPGYSEFVTHLMIAKINMILKARGIEPLIDRRQSFGFLTPTLTDTHTAVRLSLGLTPNNHWIEAVKDGIVACDTILSQLHFQEIVKKNDANYICLNRYEGNFTGYAHKLLEEITGGYTIHFTKENSPHHLSKIIKRGICESELYISLTQDGFFYASNKTNEPVFVKHHIVNSYNTDDNDAELYPTIINEAAKNGHFSTWDECEQDKKNLIKDINSFQLIELKNKVTTNKTDFKEQIEVFNIDSLPEDLTPFRNKYVLSKDKFEDKYILYYINRNKVAKEIKIINEYLFADKIVRPLTLGKKFINLATHIKGPVELDIDRIKEITGTAHPTAGIANIPLEIDENDDVAQKYNDLYERTDAILSTLADCWVQQHQDNEEESIIVNNNIIDKKKSSAELVSKSNKIAINFFTTPQDLVTYDTSDDDEPSVTHHEESKKNYRTPWGMSSLFSPMEALRRTLGDDHPLAYSCLPYSYFEVNLSWNSSLSKDHFIRSDLVIDRLAYTVRGELIIEFQKNPLGYSFTKKEKEIVIGKREFNNEAYKKFINDYVHDICNAKENSKVMIAHSKRIGTLFTIMQATSPLFTSADAGILFQKIDHSVRQTISEFYNEHQSLQAYLQANIFPTELVHIDANPCMTRDEKVVKATDAITQLSKSNSPPKVLVVDVTSTTQDQLKEIIDTFDSQDKIPLLVTAMSGLKNSQLGLDAFPYGENKIYRSAKCLERDKDLTAFCDTFSLHLKDITRGTELGISRTFRRELTSSANLAESKKIKKM